MTQLVPPPPSPHPPKKLNQHGVTHISFGVSLTSASPSPPSPTYTPLTSGRRLLLMQLGSSTTKRVGEKNNAPTHPNYLRLTSKSGCYKVLKTTTDESPIDSIGKQLHFIRGKRGSSSSRGGHSFTEELPRQIWNLLRGPDHFRKNSH